MDAKKFLFVSLILICNVTSTTTSFCTSVQWVCILIILNTHHSYHFIRDTTASTKFLPVLFLTLIAFIFHEVLKYAMLNDQRSTGQSHIHVCPPIDLDNSRPAVGFKHDSDHVMLHVIHSHISGQRSGTKCRFNEHVKPTVTYAMNSQNVKSSAHAADICSIPK